MMQIRSVLSLALLSAALLAMLPHSATAQYQMPPRWEGLYYIVTGTRTRTLTQTGDAPLPTPQYESAGYSASLSGSYQVKARFYWRRPGQTAIAPNPPGRSYFKINAKVRYWGDSGTASNSFDSVTSVSGGGESFGIHLVQKDSSSGSVLLEVPLSGSASKTVVPPANSVTVNLEFKCRVDLDQRGITIGSSLGQTYFCDNSASHTKTPHIVDADGTIHAHTRKPGLDHTITYSANPIGSGSFVMLTDINSGIAHLKVMSVSKANDPVVGQQTQIITGTQRLRVLP